MTNHTDTSSIHTSKAFYNCAYGDRKDLAKRFTQYLDHRDTQKGAYVANLNGAWGTGKTFFVDNWCQQLKEDNRLAIKIDAWESDYLKDPLAIIVAELLEQVKAQSKLKDTFSTERKIAKIFTHLSKSTISAALMGAGKVFLGEETYKDFKEVIQETGHALSNLSDFQVTPKDENLGEFGLEVFKTHKKHKAFVIEFIKLFQDLLIEANRSLSNETINDQDAEKIKTYIFIDELDRCRPTYAIEMLETVKHLFNIPNLVFVLSTDTAQLEHSIKAVYGEGFDAREYLSRFFEQRLLLPAPDHFTFLKSKNSFESLGLNENSQHLFPAINSKEKVSAVLAMFCEASNISLRRTLQLADKLEMVLLNFLNDETYTTKQVNLFELVACLITREFYFDHAEKLIWLPTYKQKPPTRETSDLRNIHAESLHDKLLPIIQIKKNLSNTTSLSIIEKIIEWSNQITENKDIYTPPNTPFIQTILGKELRSGHEDYKTLFDQSFKKLINSFPSSAYNRKGMFDLLNKKLIDELVTLTTRQIGFINEPESTPSPIQVGFNI